MAKFLINDEPRPIVTPLSGIKATRLKYSRVLKLASVSDNADVPHVLLIMEDEERAYAFKNTDELKRFRAAIDNVIEAVQLREFNVQGEKLFDMAAGL